MVQKYADDDFQQDLPYDGDLETIVSYHTLMGEIPLPVSGGPADLTILDFVSAHAPFTLKMVHWKASRFGYRPKIPKATDIDSVHVLLTYSIDGFAPDLTPDGEENQYVLQGTYVFGLTAPLLPGAEIPLAKLPIDKTGKDDDSQKIPVTAFEDLISSNESLKLQNPIQAF